MSTAGANAERCGRFERWSDATARAAGVHEHGAARHGRGGGSQRCGQRIDRHRDHDQFSAPARGRERTRCSVDGAAGERRARRAAVAVIAHSAPAASASQRQAERSADLAQADDGHCGDTGLRTGTRIVWRLLARGRWPRCSKTRRRGSQIRPQRRSAIQVDRRQPRARAHAADREKHAHESLRRPGNGHLGGAEQRHARPAEQSRRVRGEVGGQVGRGREDRAHD